jgi:hypothetical protein
MLQSFSIPLVFAQVPGLPSTDDLGSTAVVMMTLFVTLAIYALLILGQRAPDSSWKADDQIGIKVIASALILLGTMLFATGLQGLLHLLLTPFDEFGTRMKEILPHLLVGAAALGGTVLFVIPRTNHELFPKALRLTTGAIALLAVITTVISLDSLLVTIFKWPGWSPVTDTLTTLLTAIIVAVGSGYFFAKLSGLAVPEIPIPSGQPQQGMTMQQQQYPTQGQVPGYPPQQGYQPPQGQPGYPPNQPPPY